MIYTLCIDLVRHWEFWELFAGDHKSVGHTGGTEDVIGVIVFSGGVWGHKSVQILPVPDRFVDIR